MSYGTCATDLIYVVTCHACTILDTYSSSVSINASYKIKKLRYGNKMFNLLYHFYLIVNSCTYRWYFFIVSNVVFLNVI